MRALLFPFAALCFGVFPSARADDIELRTTVEDLEVLATKEAWSELVMRLPDVLPAQRNQRWEKIVERAAIGYLSTINAEGMTGADSVALEMTRTYPSLRRSKEFMTQRNGYALGAFERCFTGTEPDAECSARLLTFVEDDRENVEFVVKAAKLVAQKRGPAAALPLYRASLSATTRAALCGHAEVRATLVAALGAGRDSAEAFAFVDNECWAWLKTDLVTEFERAPAGTFGTAVCPLLKRKNAFEGMPVTCTPPPKETKKPRGK